VVDLCGGLGIVVPSLTRIKPGLSVLAALRCAGLRSRSAPSSSTSRAARQRIPLQRPARRARALRLLGAAVPSSHPASGFDIAARAALRGLREQPELLMKASQDEERLVAEGGEGDRGTRASALSGRERRESVGPLCASLIGLTRPRRAHVAATEFGKAQGPPGPRSCWESGGAEAGHAISTRGH
jgi:hypothetical protein